MGGGAGGLGTPMWSGPRGSPAPEIASAEEQPGSHIPPARRDGGLTRPVDHQVRGPTSMHPYLLQEIARQREEDLRRAARRYGPAGLVAGPGLGGGPGGGGEAAPRAGAGATARGR